MHCLRRLGWFAIFAGNRRESPSACALSVRIDRSCRPKWIHPIQLPMASATSQSLRWEKFGRGKNAWLWHGFSTRLGGLSSAYCAEDAPGDLNLGFTAADDRETVLRNRRLLVEAVTGEPSTPLVTLRQIHSSVLTVIGSTPELSDGSPSPACKGDGLMTAEPGVLLGIQTADCIPVLVADRKRRVVAAFHAGWRGTVRRIVETGVGRMRIEFGCGLRIYCCDWPGIGPAAIRWAKRCFRSSNRKTAMRKSCSARWTTQTRFGSSIRCFF